MIFLPVIVNGADETFYRKVNAPYFSDFMPASRMAVFWFGKITPSENYTDVRVGYSDTELVVQLNTIDRLLWYDTSSPSASNLIEWDSATLYLSTKSDPGDALSAQEYRFVAQLNNFQSRENYQAVYRGNGTGWDPVNIPFTTESGWRGQSLNDDQSDKGWTMKYSIPFESLGYSNTPHNFTWRLAIELHDRDSATDTNIADKYWPETLNTLVPDTWGGVQFGQSSYTPPGVSPNGVTTIKNGVQGAVVQDGHVGGAFNCGDNINHWTQWGEMNYENIEPTQINIQNQMDVSDWPCFSKYFVTFPLDQIPEGSTFISATLTMNHFGNSGGVGWEDPPQRSWIQVLTIADHWADTTITWNNAPLAQENISVISVEPVDTFPGWPGIPYTWDVSKAVMDALESGNPLRLALYSADAAIHSGKYFYSSNSNSDGSGRPVVHIYWHSP